MGQRPKYADEKSSESILDIPDHNVGGHVSSPRRYHPDSGVTSILTDMATGDWSWKPHRDKRLGENFVTYRPARHPLAGIRF